MPTVLLRLIFVVLFPLVSITARAEALTDSAFQSVYSRYFKVYSDKTHRDEFYTLSLCLQRHYLEVGNKKSYYMIKMNEVLYETEDDHPYHAIKLSYDMMKEMEADGYNGYSNVYAALGTVFQSRGNYVMAERYFNDALESLEDGDELSAIGIKARLAFLLMLRNPTEAARWNEMYATQSLKWPHYHQAYLFLRAVIEFAQGNCPAFGRTLTEYRRYHDSHGELDDYGQHTLNAIEQAYIGNYDEALALADSAAGDLDRIALFDLRMHIHEMRGDFASALREADARSRKIDTLNTDMMFDNMNSINAEAGLASARQKEADTRELFYKITLAMAVIIIMLMAFLAFYFLRSRRELSRKNEQLASALSMTEEADKMKTEFVRSVSHEIRTPLNAISGFNQVLNAPGVELSAEERQGMLERVRESVDAITVIVDEMLQMAEQESTMFYPKRDTVMCNQFLSQILQSYQRKVPASVELRYTTKVLNRFSIVTSAEGVRRIVDHLLANAVKFTSKGHIELSCEQDGNKLIISVADTGTGISEEKRGKIFEQFFKADSFRQGIGLGLAVSKKIAKKIGGDLTFDDTYTGGSRFVLMLEA